MDIIDVMLARALTPQGRIESYAAQSQQAVAQANQAIAAIDSITEQTQANNEAAQTAMENAQTAMENAAAAEQRVDAALESVQAASEQQIENKIDELAFSLTRNANASAIVTDMVVSTPSGLAKTVDNINKMYRTTGQNEDGTMTQKAITDALAQKANSADVATKAYVDTKVAGGGGTGVSNLGVDAAGKIVIVGPDGTVTPGSLTEAEIADAIVNGGGSANRESLGLLIDYDNKNFERIFGAANLVAGSSFNTFAMYGGRMRCNVADDGTINAFYGDTGYTEDGSNGQVMIYQPKFYYQRLIVAEVADAQGRVISKEQLLLSPVAHVGFKIHPLFVKDGVELDYVLLPAYEGSIYDTSESTYITNNANGIDINNDKLSSIANVLPFTGSNKNLVFDNLRQLAANRGEGWCLTDIRAESLLQMLFMVEYGSLNSQYALGKGIVNAKSIGDSVTGSTANLGNASGRAGSTTFINGATTTAQTDEDVTAIAYRGMENPWGNIWRAIDNLLIKGNGKSNGGVPYFNTTESMGFNLPDMTYGWISNMGIGAEDYDWAYIPIKCDNKGNSAVPVGDNTWTTTNLNNTNIAFVGGSSTATEGAGLFDYSFDGAASSTVNRINARIMFIPEKNAIYTANIDKWQQHYGG